MKIKKVIELILLPKVLYTFKELKIKISIILFSFFVEALEARKQTILFGLREDHRLMVEFESLVLNCGQTSEVKLMPNEGSRLILKGSRFKLSRISPSANQPIWLLHKS